MPATVIIALYAVAGGLFRLSCYELQGRTLRVWCIRTAVRVLACALAEALLGLVYPRAAWWATLAAGGAFTWEHNAHGQLPTARKALGARALVTGATSGIGFATAVALCKRGVDVVVPARSLVAGVDAATAINAAAGGPGKAVATEKTLDLTSVASVRDFAAYFNGFFADKPTLGLSLLVLNAGVMRPEYGTSADGAELTVAANHLGHFQLARHLAPGLEAAAAAGRDVRVVVVSSSLHRKAARRLDTLAAGAAAEELTDLTGEKDSYTLFGFYARTKLMNVLFARAFAKRHPKISCVSAHPGFVYTSVTRHLPAAVRAAHRLAVPFWLLFQKLPGAGAHATVHALLDPSLSAKVLKGRSAYIADCEAEEPGLPRKAEDLAEALWRVSDGYVERAAPGAERWR